MEYLGYLGFGLLATIFVVNSARKQTDPLGIPTAVNNISCSEADIVKYQPGLNDILNKTREAVKGSESGYKTRIDDSRFGRTGYHDEQEFNTYQAILFKEGIKVNRMNHTGLDSSISATVM